VKKEPVAPGDDICPVPAPVDEVPPLDRYCDLVLTGGVASGVVYPWAIVELARAYRFRNIGGTSVGAMAAALAAAAEYGRRTGYEMPFETLRRLPAALGEELPDGRTRMLSLFQPAPQGRRLIRLWARLFQGMPPGSYDRKTQDPPASAAPESPESPESPPAPVAAPKVRIGPVIAEVAKAYGAAIASGAFGGALLAWAIGNAQGQHAAWTTVVLGLALAVVCAALALLADLRHDIRRGIVDNGLGLCKGGTLEPQDPDDPRPGLSEWLHEGIQRSAGLKLSDPPLTFGDLWTAPAYPGAPLTPCTDADPPGLRAINLQMISTNVTHGRPYRLPLADETSRLFFRPDELRPYLPRAVFDALLQAAPSYVPRSSSDPPAGDDTRELRELPGAGLPVAAAARLSLSFPLLFSAVPLYAIDYEQREAGSRRLRRCWFTDGGVSSNFPIHIFDAALPRWPTFGLWLGRQDPYQRPDDALVWLPDFHGRGWGDNWNRFDPATLPTMAEGATTPPAAVPAWLAPWKMLGGFLVGLATTATDWRDRTSFRLPHVRNRVARLWLRAGEGGLHIGMPRRQILEMAHRYGTLAGRLFVDQFCSDDGREKAAWREQRWVRLQLLISSLRERLSGLSASAAYAAFSVPLPRAIRAAAALGPVRDHGDGGKLDDAQAASLQELLAELVRLEGLMKAAVPQPYKPRPEPELRLRAPL